MSDLSNPFDGAKDRAEGYVRAILALAADHDPMTVLADSPGEARRLVAGLDDEQMRTPEAPGKWSAAQVVQHLADSELVWGYRLRRIMAEDRPAITGFDQDRWANGLGYAQADVAAALDVYASLRRANLALLRAADDATLDRVGVHAERGEETLRGMLPLYAGHDLAHRNQLARIRARLERTEG